MTDTAQPAAAQDAGTSNDIRDTTEPPVPAAAPPPLLPDGLSDDNAKRAEANRWDTADDIVAADRTLERDVAASLRPPGEAASAHEWDAFYRQLGRPEAASDYEFAMPEGLAADFPYDESAAGHFTPALSRIGNFGAFLDGAHDTEKIAALRGAEGTGRPTGSDGFLAALEDTLGRSVRPTKRRPKKKAAT